MNYLLKNLFSEKLYVKVYKNRMVLRDLNEERPPESFPSEVAFTSNRLLVGSFTEAERCLKKAIKEFYSEKLITPYPLILIQQCEINEGGLSEVEERVLQELSFGAGARKVIVGSEKNPTDEKMMEILKNA